jgi:hypothetical protein
MSDSSLAVTRDVLHRVAVHVVARARVAATGRFSLRVTSGGLGTPEFDDRRVRIADGWLLVESDAPGAASASGRAIHGASLRVLAEFAGVDLDAPLDVGHDTPLLGDIDEALCVPFGDARDLGRWYSLAGRALDGAVGEIAIAGGRSTLPRLWPEHFDVAIEAEARPDRRVNLGASPGDAFCADPYWYVGPWTAERPGDSAFWNAPFGAVLPAVSLDPDESDAGLRFLLDGLERLR